MALLVQTQTTTTESQAWSPQATGSLLVLVLCLNLQAIITVRHLQVIEAAVALETAIKVHPQATVVQEEATPEVARQKIMVSQTNNLMLPVEALRLQRPRQIVTVEVHTQQVRQQLALITKTTR